MNTKGYWNFTEVYMTSTIIDLVIAGIVILSNLVQLLLKSRGCCMNWIRRIEPIIRFA